MVVKVSNRTWLVVVEDASVVNYARRIGHRQSIHGYVRWDGTGFQAYFSHATQQSPDREVRRQPPMVIPVPINPDMSSAVRSCLMAEFCQVIFKPDLLSTQSLDLSYDSGVPAGDRAEAAEVSKMIEELQAEIDSLEE